MPRIANAAAEVSSAILRSLTGRPAIVYRARGRPPAVALTFDDGPGPWTAVVAKTLEEHGCRGTFFLLGSAVGGRSEIVAALAAAGHELGSHLWSHRDAGDLSCAEIRSELERTATAVRDAAGVAPSLVRPPYCSAPIRVARAAARSGIRLVVQRSIDPEDWRAASAEQVAADVGEAVGPGDIVCLHDGVVPSARGTSSREVTVDALALLVPLLLDRGLRPVTVSELLR